MALTKVLITVKTYPAISKKFVLNKVYTDMSLLIAEAKNRAICTSLAVFKPTKIIDFIWKEVDREWSEDKLAQFQQLNLFQQVDDKKIEVVKKLPYKFSFIFEDINGKSCTVMIEDWETGVLFWNCLKRNGGDELKACNDVRKKYFDDFSMTKDLYFFLGTTSLHHFTGKNPFLIIGTFHPKHITQMSLF